MAPLAPMGRDGVIALARRGPLPFSFGSPHPFVMLLKQDGVYRIRDLVVDQEEAKAAFAAAMAARRSWTPEQRSELGRPTGKIHVEAPSLNELLEKLRTMSWPADW